MRHVVSVSVAVMGLAIVLGTVGCGGGETATVSISYVLEPAEGKGLPEGMNSLAILDSDAKGGVDEQKWSTMAADMIQAMIQESNDKFNCGIEIANRREMNRVMAEQDLKMAGLVEGGQAAQVAKLTNAKGLVLSFINIKVEKHEGKGRTLSGLSAFAYGGHGWGGGGGSAQTEETSSISRNVTVQTKFQLMDPATSKDYLTYAPRPYRKFDNKKPGPVFGSGKTEADLDPRDMLVGQLVERGVREFVAQLVPCEVHYDIPITSSSSEASEMGVRYVRGDELEGSLQAFQQAISENPKDDVSTFNAGVVSEALGRPDQALKYYRQACILKDDPVYLDAKNRLNEHNKADKFRIRKAEK